MDARLLEILVCPLCKGPLDYRKQKAELVCKPCRLTSPITDDVPIILEDEARHMPADED